jgi:ubiquinone biosynthesis protein UbiJ
MADEPINLVLEILQAVRTDLAAVKTDVAAVKEDVASLKTVQRTQSRTLGILLQEGRLIRAAVNDIAKENVTPGEMEAVHDDLTQLRQEVDGLTVRIEMIEERNKDH